MSNVLISGDMHGYKPALERACKLARDNNVHHIFQVGDFGLWPGLSGVQWLDDCQRTAEDNSLTIFALPGNHEDHPQWIMALSSDNPKHKDTGGTYVRSNVVLLPRACTFNWFGKTWGVAGGAVSIDKDARVPGRDWWWQEQLEDWEADMLRIKVDILLTHDASNHTPWGFPLIPDMASQIHRQRIDRVISNTAPEVHFHGHMHQRYDWHNPLGYNGHCVQTYGLDCNGKKDSNGILNTKTLEFRFLD